MNVTSAEPEPALSLSAEALAPPGGGGAAAVGAARRQTILRRQLLSADVSAGILTGLLAGVVGGLGIAAATSVALALAAVWPVLAYVCGLYAADDLRSWATGVGDAPRLALTCLLISWPVYGVLWALGAESPVAGALTASVLIGAGAGIGRAAARAAVHRAPRLRQRTLILGSGVVADQLIQRVRRHHELGLDPIGFLDDDAVSHEALGVPWLGGLDRLPELIAAQRIDRVMIAFSRANHEEFLQAIRLCRDASVTVDIVPRLFEFLDGARTVDQIGGMPLLSIQVPTFSRLSRASKRALDITGSGFALLAFSPVLALIAAAIKLDSPGPVLFTQQRAGRAGTFFKLYKFRSMRPDSTVLVRDDGAIVKSAHDDRITRVGRIIRRFSLDEIPQLYNVLRGDMSLVGPRPLVLAEHAALEEEWQGRRADLRPGLTGPWQVSGRSQIPFHEMIRFDYQYVAGWSLARDVEILLATLPAVLSGRGAY